MAEASKGGWVSRAARSSASTRPVAWLMATRSASSGTNPCITRTRASATERRAISSSTAKRAGAAAGLFHKADAAERDRPVNRLHHVVDGEGGAGNRRECLYLDSGLGIDLGGRLNAQARRI